MTNPHPEPGPGASVQEIVDDIERTRQQLGETVDALATKLDVKTQVKHTVHEARTNVTESAGHAAETARQRWPELAIVLVTAVAVAVVWRRMP